MYSTCTCTCIVYIHVHVLVCSSFPLSLPPYQPTLYMYMYLIKTLRKTKQHNTTQTPRQLFEKELHLRWDSNPHLTYSGCNTLPTELLRQLSWLSSNHLSKARQSKRLNLINRFPSHHPSLPTTLPSLLGARPPHPPPTLTLTSFKAISLSSRSRRDPNPSL